MDACWGRIPKWEPKPRWCDVSRNRVMRLGQEVSTTLLLLCRARLDLTLLIEIFKNEKRVDQLVKKIESKRPVNDKYYLKRTKGTQEKVIPAKGIQEKRA